MQVFAQESLGRIGGEGLGPFGNIPLDATTALEKVTGGISAVIGIMTVGASIWFIFQLLVGGIAWLTSGGDKQKLSEARDRLTNAFVGLLIVVAGWAILALTGQFLGWDILISDPGSIIRNLQIQ